MKPAIRVENLSKQYRLGARAKESYRTLRESITDTVAAPFRRLARSFRQAARGADEPDTLWALKDVSFEVQPGEVVGIIGRNGAGKSTLLKILSRIVEPTSGHAEIRGRMGSLLEVGTGFHPELTGRENIFLNGSILGMSRREIQRKFDEIVAFSEIEKFLDTPVKRYSSGMYVRLAFAVAAHLEPEILVVDEVLAVGDVAFQQKCVAKMRQAGRDGRTVLFVSHNMSAIQALCSRGLILENGWIEGNYPAAYAVAQYLNRMETRSVVPLHERTDRRGKGCVKVLRAEIIGGDNENPGTVPMGNSLELVFHIDKQLPGTVCVVALIDWGGVGIARFNSALACLDDVQQHDGQLSFACKLNEILLAPGRYRVDVVLMAHGELQDQLEDAAQFEVVRSPIRGREPPSVAKEWIVFLPHTWKTPRWQ